MKPVLPGLHHVTAITSNAQSNIDFYCDVLGLRLIKVTVNFDDPHSYHLYYGDMHGRPGTALTFFVWNGAGKGRVGWPQAVETSFAIPVGSTMYWRERLAEKGVPVIKDSTRFGESFLSFHDPDDMKIELIECAHPSPAKDVPVAGLTPPVQAEMALQGFHSVTLLHPGPSATSKLLQDVMGYPLLGTEGARSRYSATGGMAGTNVDVVQDPQAKRGGLGSGVVHHVAFRTPDDAQELAWQDALRSAGYQVSDVMDRSYFHSIYFREPSGFLFEIATDGPGFTADEPLETLGMALRLPPWMEADRISIEASLPPLRRPAWTSPCAPF